MKVINFIITTILLILAVSFSYCSKRGESGGDVPYKFCPCDEDKSSFEHEGSFCQGKAYLVRDSIPKDQEFPQLEVNKDNPQFSKTAIFIIDSKSNFNCLFIGGFMSASLDRVCNIPDFVYHWNIPENGYIIVYFEGTIYKTCEHKSYQQCCGYDASSMGGLLFSYDLILKKFKKL